MKNFIPTHGGPIRIGLVDSQQLFRGGLRMLIDREADMRIVGEARDPGQALRLVERQRPDVLLMELQLPGMDGIAAIRDIVSRGHATRVLVLSTIDLDEAVAGAAAAGASGFVLKDAEPNLLLASIRAIYAGGEVFAARATASVIRQCALQQGRGGCEPEELGKLTERERQMFYFAASGLSNGEIAQREYLSEATVKTHISRILAKLALRDRVQLVVYAHGHGLV